MKKLILLSFSLLLITTGCSNQNTTATEINQYIASSYEIANEIATLTKESYIQLNNLNADDIIAAKSILSALSVETNILINDYYNIEVKSEFLPLKLVVDNAFKKYILLITKLETLVNFKESIPVELFALANTEITVLINAYIPIYHELLNSNLNSDAEVYLI